LISALSIIISSFSSEISIYFLLLKPIFLLYFFIKLVITRKKAYKLMEVYKKIILVLLGFLEHIATGLEVYEVFDNKELEVYNIINIIGR
jgi:hypothetical protein